MRHGLLRVALGTAGCVVVAACGSTAAPQAGGGLANGGPSGVTAPGTGSGGGSTTTGGVLPPNASTGGTTGGGTVSGGPPGTLPGTSTGSGGTAGGGTTDATTGGAAPSGATASGPGITATEVRIGIPYCNDCASANAAVGASGQDPGDTRRYYQAVLDDVNSRGGVIGRKLVPVFQQISAADNIDASAQAACEKFTKDTKVAAFAFRGEVAAACGLKAGVMVLGSGATGPVFQRYPNLFAPASIRLEGLYGATVRAMVKAGWHKPSTPWPTGKIGLITWDDNDFRYAMKNGYLKELHAAGLKETDLRYIAVPQNAGAIADASAAISNAVLSFRQKGIDHVFIGDGPAGIFAGTGLTLLFLQNAKSQSYYPRYGFNSNNSPSYQNHPKDELVGMIAIDAIDTNALRDEGMALNPVRERCFALMKKNGLPVGDDQTRNLAVNACEIGWFPAAVLNKAGSSALSRVLPAAESLGTSYRSPLTYGTRIAPGKHDGIYLFRNLSWDTGCSCNKYSSKPYEP
jgi:hypothetical protein